MRLTHHWSERASHVAQFSVRRRSRHPMNEAQKSILQPVAITVAGLIAAGSVLFAVWMLFLVVVFFGNFHFQLLSHIGIFLETCVFIVTAIMAGIVFLRSPSVRGYILVALAACLSVLTFWLWSIPAARGLVH